MTRQRFAERLEEASEQIADVPREELQILLRRAALRLRNTSGLALDPEISDILDEIAGEMQLTRNELIRSIIRDWLIGNAYLPANMLEEDGETDGEA